MYLSTTDLLDMDVGKLRAFVERGLAENRYLEYKEARPGKNEKQRKEKLLKEITAFANASGGDLLLGVKEPKNGLSLDERLVGLEDWELLKRQVESWADSLVEPRIPGFQVVPVKLSEKLGVIICHVPASLAGPHSIYLKGWRAFYARGTEQAQIMTYQQIRDAILYAATAEGRANEYMERFEEEVRQYRDGIALFVQAAPLGRVEPRWSIRSPDFIAAVADVGPSTGEFRPNLYGATAKLEPEPGGELDVHREGYFAMRLLVSNRAKPDYSPDPVFSWKDHGQCILEFCELANILSAQSGADVPYLLRCTAIKISSAKLALGGPWGDHKFPQPRAVLRWPDQMREPGQSFLPLGNRIMKGLCHAYGVDPPPA